MTILTGLWYVAAGAQLMSAAACIFIGWRGERRRDRALAAHHAEMMRMATAAAAHVHELTIEHLNKLAKDLSDYVAQENYRLTRLEIAVFGATATAAQPAAPGKVN